MKRYKQNEIEELASILKNDGVISVPTDTVYGICARIHSKKAYDKLVEVKNRPANKSFPVMCLNEEQIKSVAIVSVEAEKLIRAFMPGPITLVLPKKLEAFSYINNAGERISDELAVRMAPLTVLEEILEKTGSPLFLTSANISGGEVCKSLEEIENTCPGLDGILEGEISFGKASTIVDCTAEEIKIQRHGPISEEEIRKVLGK